MPEIPSKQHLPKAQVKVWQSDCVCYRLVGSCERFQMVEVKNRQLNNPKALLPLEQSKLGQVPRRNQTSRGSFFWEKDNFQTASFGLICFVSLWVQCIGFFSFYSPLLVFQTWLGVHALMRSKAQYNHAHCQKSQGNHSVDQHHLERQHHGSVDQFYGQSL